MGWIAEVARVGGRAERNLILEKSCDIFDSKKLLIGKIRELFDSIDPLGNGHFYVRPLTLTVGPIGLILFRTIKRR